MAESGRNLLRALVLLVLIAALSVAVPGATEQAGAQSSSGPRTVMVHLFEWRWADIAKECENFLGPRGFSAVQVSPPNEHRLVTTADGAPVDYPWWQRYQPVTYQIESRSGTRAAFADMVARCKAVGVDVYVDAVINHTTTVGSGSGIAGSTYTEYDYPIYAPWDFHYCGTTDENGNVTHDLYDYQQRWQVQTCELVNLADLDTADAYVQDTIAAYLSDLLSLGVTGFRIDASKHIYTDDIKAILARVNGIPYVYQEVIDQGGEPVTADEYFQNGDVTEFKYSNDLSRVFREGSLAWFNGDNQFGEGWGYMASDKAVVFVDNHDNQRGHGSGGDIITHKDGKLYDLANVFMLAWPYGYPRVMSSYHFVDDDEGPPSDPYGNTKPVYNDDGTLNCFGDEWKCEHRWRPITNMVSFRNHTASAFYVSNWWDNGNNQIAFGRGDKGYVVINREGYDMDRWFYTGLPAGDYCNIIDGTYFADSNSCTGPTITVNGDGWAHIPVPAMHAAAIHVGAKVN